MITARINLKEVEKHRLYKGEKGIYLNCVLIETPNSEFNDYMIVQEITKEERTAGQESPKIGNAKIFVKESKLSEEEQNELPY